MPKKKLSPIHPGEILMEDFLKALGITQYRLAKEIKVPAIRVSQIIHGKRAITADTALRLAKYFGTSAELWVNLQSSYDLKIKEDEIGEFIDKEIPTFCFAR